jgi:hypothetical protein
VEQFDSYVEVDEGATALVVMKERRIMGVSMEDCYRNWLEYQTYSYRWIDFDPDEQGTSY